MEPNSLESLAKAIPKEGWAKLVDTACTIISDFIAPITKTTAGLGGLIQAKFDGMIDVQKVFAADAVAKAREKVERTNRPTTPRPKARVLIPAIENASLESDDDLREIWANLIANEMLEGDVHPEFPAILARFSINDALTLSHFAEKKRSEQEYRNLPFFERIVQSFRGAFSGSQESDTFSPSDFDREHLENLGLLKKIETLNIQLDGRDSGTIRPRSVNFKLSSFGRGFISAVVDPNDKAK